MRTARGRLRGLGVALGMGICLGSAALRAQDIPATNPQTKGGSASPAPGSGEMKDETKKAATPKGKARRGSSRTAPRAAPEPKAEPKATAVAADDAAIKFSRDVAPIFVANCMGCHNPTAKRRNGEFDLSTFNALMKGGKSGQVIVPGKPEESQLIELISSQEMPRGNRGKLSEEAVAKVAEWVKAGALLDAKIDATAALDKIAATPEQLRKMEIARQSPEERDKKIEETAIERWKKASARVTPQVTSGKNFLLFSNLPKPRAERLLKTMETQRTTIGNVLGREAAQVLSGPEKISLYVFNDPASYVEFVRSVESREGEPGVESHGRLDVEQPYIAAVDPLNGGEEAAPVKSRTSRSKKTQDKDEESGPDRSVAGLVSEALGSAAINSAGKPPRWLSQGFGVFLSSQIDPRDSSYYEKLRRTVAQQYTLGWETKASEALGGEGDPETIRAVGFSLCEWLASSFRPQFPFFIQGMLQGGEKFDDTIRACFGEEVTRQDFLNQWGNFLVVRYGAGRRR